MFDPMIPEAAIPEVMTVETLGSERNFVDAWLFSNRRSMMKKSLTVLICGVAMLGLRVILRDEVGTVFAILGGWFMLLAFLLPPVNRNIIRRYYRKHPILDESKTYNLTPEGMSCDSYSSRIFIRWHAFSHWRETSRLFLMYLGASASYYIPKQSLGDETRIAELRGILQKAIGRTKYVAPVKAFPVSAPTDARVPSSAHIENVE